MWVWIVVSVSTGVSVVRMSVSRQFKYAIESRNKECAIESKQHESLKSLVWFSCAPGCKKPSPPDTIDSTRDKLCQS